MTFENMQIKATSYDVAGGRREKRRKNEENRVEKEQMEVEKKREKRKEGEKEKIKVGKSDKVKWREMRCQTQIPDPHNT